MGSAPPPLGGNRKRILITGSTGGAGQLAAAHLTGEFLFHQQVETRVHELVNDSQAQDRLLAAYAEQTASSSPQVAESRPEGSSNGSRTAHREDRRF